MSERVQKIRLALSILLVLAGCSRSILFFGNKASLIPPYFKALSMYCFAPLTPVFDAPVFYSRFELTLSGAKLGTVKPAFKILGPWHWKRMIYHGISNAFGSPPEIQSRFLRFYFCSNLYDPGTTLPKPDTVTLKEFSKENRELNSLTVECTP